MNAFDMDVWNRFAGDTLIIATYVLGPLGFLLAGLKENEDLRGICMWSGVFFTVLAHLISAGVIK